MNCASVSPFQNTHGSVVSAPGPGGYHNKGKDEGKEKREWGMERKRIGEESKGNSREGERRCDECGGLDLESCIHVYTCTCSC